MRRIPSIIGIALAAGVALSACGIAETSSDTEPSPPPSHSPSDSTDTTKGSGRKGG